MDENKSKMELTDEELEKVAIPKKDVVDLHVRRLSDDLYEIPEW